MRTDDLYSSISHITSIVENGLIVRHKELEFVPSHPLLLITITNSRGLHFVLFTIRFMKSIKGTSLIVSFVRAASVIELNSYTLNFKMI